MKTILLLILVVVFTSCGRVPETPVSNDTPKETTLYDINAVEIELEGCQYIGNNFYGNGAWLTHKGNCTNVIHSLR